MKYNYLPLVVMGLISTTVLAQFGSFGDTIDRALGTGNQDQQSYQSYQKQQRYQDQQGNQRYQDQLRYQDQQRYQEQQRYEDQQRYDDRQRYKRQQSVQYRHHRHVCPPGLAKKNNRCVPPGQANMR